MVHGNRALAPATVVKARGVQAYLAPYLVAPQRVEQGLLSFNKGCSGCSHGLPRPIPFGETSGSPKVPTKANLSCTVATLVR